MKQYFLNLLIALDQLVTAIFGGWPDETISSYLWRLERQRKWAGRLLRPVVDWLFSPIEPEHCARAFEVERARRQLPPELRS